MTHLATVVSVVAFAAAALLLVVASLLREVPPPPRPVRASGGEVALRDPEAAGGARHARVGPHPAAALLADAARTAVPVVPVLLVGTSALALVATAVRLLTAVS